jgi:glycerol-1-phosphate dehydrogenase [NAD(P)+]
LKAGNKPPQHGAAVGVATLLVWPVFLRFAREDLSRLDLNKIKAEHLSREERAAWMRYAYGETAADEIMSENEGDFLSWEEQARRIGRTQKRFGEIKACIENLPSYDRIKNAMKALGAPMTPAECGIEPEVMNLSMHCAKDYRTRYTLFKTLDECGILGEYLKGYNVAGI